MRRLLLTLAISAVIFVAGALIPEGADFDLRDHHFGGHPIHVADSAAS